MLKLRLLCAVLFLIAVTRLHSYAQAVNGTVVGTITDSSGAVVPGANVAITNIATSSSRTAATDGNGFYTFPNLPPGTYTVTVRKQGFETAKQANVVLLVNSTQRVDLTLSAGQVSETVTVTTAPPLLQTDTARTGATMSAEQTVDLPLGNNRNFQNMINLVPGATRAEFNHSRFFNPQNSLNNEVNG